MQNIIVTLEGKNKMQEEYDHLVLVRRKEVAQHLKEAVAFGDLSENAEYAAAREEQLEVETKIRTLGDKLSRVQIITGDMIDKEEVHIGSKVIVLDDLKEEVEYTIVGENEGNIYEGKLSLNSAVGKALMGKRLGNVVEILVPSGETVEYKILKITPVV